MTNPSCTNEGQTSKTRNIKQKITPGVYVYACPKAKNKMHRGKTDIFLMQIKRKISVIVTAKPMHLSIEDTMLTIMVTFSIGQFYFLRSQRFPDATTGFPKGC